MPNAVAPWIIAQKGGDKSLVLRGWCAPFGRPRQKPVVSEEIVMHESTIRYPDSQGSVTRHVFGPGYTDWELTGRFLDRYLGKGGANILAESIKDFIRDGKPVEVQWGDHVHVEGFMKKFKIKREGGGYIEWEMTLMVDQDLRALKPNERRAAKTFNPEPKLRQLAGYLFVVDSYQRPGKSPFGFLPKVLDHIDNAVSKVTGTVGTLNGLVGDLKDLKKATFGQLNRLRQGLLQAKTATTDLFALIRSARDDALVFAEQVRGDPERFQSAVTASGDRLSLGVSADQDLAMRDWAINAEVSLMHMLAILAQLDKDCEIAEQGGSQSAYTAKQGDSWESIAAKKLGSAAKADLLRQRNKIRYGQPPIPGRRYVIPILA